MKAGLDIGTALVKAAWNESNTTRFLSTADCSLSDLYDRLEQAGVTELVVTGQGQADIPSILTVRHRIDYFRSLQRGVNVVLPAVGQQLQAYIILDIGNSIKYLMCLSERDRVSEMPFPSPIGGGMIKGLSELLALSDLLLFDQLAATGAPPDLITKDIDPRTGGTIAGQETIAHFALADAGTPMADACAGLLRLLADQIVRDLKLHRLLLNSLPGTSVAVLPPILPVGTLISRMPSLVELLKLQLGLQLFVPLVLPYAEYLSAIGALNAPDSDRVGS